MWWTLFLIHRAHLLMLIGLCATCSFVVSLGRLLFLSVPFEGSEKGLLVCSVIATFACTTMLSRMRHETPKRLEFILVGHVSAIWDSLPAFPPIERIAGGPDVWRIEYGKNRPYIAPGEQRKIEAYAIGMAAMIATEEAFFGNPSIASRQGLQEIRMLEHMAGKPLLRQSLERARTIIAPIRDQVRILAEQLKRDGCVDQADLERVLGPRKDIWDLAAKKNT